MTDTRKRWFNEDGLDMIEPDPRWETPDYEPIEQPRPDDIVYKLDYDSDLCQPLTFCNTLSFLLRIGRCMRLAA